MTIEKWRTGDAVHKGELTLDSRKAREKLRDYRLPDPHRWLIEMVAAANLGGASRVSVQIDADEVMIVLHGIELTEEDITTLWQAPFKKQNNPVTSRIALGLISAEALAPKRILLRSGSFGADLGPGHNRNLLERITTQLYPEDSAENEIQVYVRIPLKLSRMLVEGTTLPEFVSLKNLAKYSKVPVDLLAADASSPDLQISSGDFGILGNQRLDFNTNGLDGALNLTTGLLRITFVRDGVVTETIEQDSLIPADIVVRTDRVNYDLSGTKIIKDEAYHLVIRELIQNTKQAFESRLALNLLSPSFDVIKTRLFVELLTDFAYERNISNAVPTPLDISLASKLCAHRMWLCAGTPPAGVSMDSAGRMLVSLNDAMPNGNHLNRSATPLSVEFGDRAVLLTGEETNYLTVHNSVARPIIEDYLEATSSDISGQVHTSARRIAAEAGWRQNPVKNSLIERVEPNTYVSSKDTSVQIGHVQAPLTSEIVFTHKGNILLQVSGVSGVQVLVQNVNPNEHFTGIADDDIAGERAKTFAALYLDFLSALAASRSNSAVFSSNSYRELHGLTVHYAQDRLLDFLIHFGQRASDSVEIDPSDLIDLSIFSTLPREAELVYQSTRLFNMLSAGAFLDKAKPLLSARQLLTSGKHLAVCNAREVGLLIEAKYWNLDPDYVVVVGDENTGELLRLITGIKPVHAASRHRKITGKIAFENKRKTAFVLPKPKQFAITTDTQTSTGHYLAGLCQALSNKIEVRFFYEGRVVEEAEFESKGGAFVVVCHDQRLTISSDFRSLLHDDARATVESEITELCAQLALKYIQENSTPELNRLATAIYVQLLLAGDLGAQGMPVLHDLFGVKHSMKAAGEWSQCQFVRQGERADAALVCEGLPVLIIPKSFPAEALPNSKDVSESPLLREQKRSAKARFEASGIVPIQLSRHISRQAKPDGSYALAGGNFANKTTSGVVNLIGFERSLVKITVLHQRRHVATHTLVLPFGEFEAVVDISDIELDDFYKEIKYGAHLADDLIKAECGKCLLTWLRASDLHDDSIDAVRDAGTSLVGWSSEHAKAAAKLVGSTGWVPEPVVVPRPKTTGAEDECFRLLEEIRGDSTKSENVAARGIELRELGTGLPSQANGNVVLIDPTHPTNKLALETNDLVWRAMLVSSAFTSLNQRWLSTTDEQEEEFHIRMLEYMVKALRPTGGR